MNQVLKYRMMNHLKQKELADELQPICPGIDVSLISKMERGLCEPSPIVCEYIQNTLANDSEKSLGQDGLITQSKLKKLISGDFYGLVYQEILQGSEDKPVSREHLVAVTGKNDRDVRRAIEQLRRAGARIGSSSYNAGYWICRTENQYKALRTEYMSRLKSIASVVSAMDRSVDGQIEMEV